MTQRIANLDPDPSTLAFEQNKNPPNTRTERVS